MHALCPVGPVHRGMRRGRDGEGPIQNEACSGERKGRGGALLLCAAVVTRDFLLSEMETEGVPQPFHMPLPNPPAGPPPVPPGPLPLPLPADTGPPPAMPLPNPAAPPDTPAPLLEDVVTQLQMKLAGLSTVFFDSLGCLQRDAPPLDPDNPNPQVCRCVGGLPPGAGTTVACLRPRPLSFGVRPSVRVSEPSMSGVCFKFRTPLCTRPFVGTSIRDGYNLMHGRTGRACASVTPHATAERICALSDLMQKAPTR